MAKKNYTIEGNTIYAVLPRLKAAEKKEVKALRELGYDVVFVDAPYDNPELGRVCGKKIGGVAKSGTILIWEQESVNFIVADEAQWEMLRDKTYGRARFLILEKK